MYDFNFILDNVENKSDYEYNSKDNSTVNFFQPVFFQVLLLLNIQCAAHASDS